jgi:hypothetical protein
MLQHLPNCANTWVAFIAEDGVISELVVDGLPLAVA